MLEQLWPIVCAFLPLAVTVTADTPSVLVDEPKLVGQCTWCHVPIYENESRVICPTCGALLHWHSQCVQRSDDGCCCPCCKQVF
ncbi:MAG: hypothetical protein JXD18_02985 [Anaerolineae bacterium]|nr:hypothetical protein [Anaerolineae bacterium]